MQQLKQLLKRALLPNGTHPRRIRGGALRGRRFHLDLQADTQCWRGVYEQELQAWLTRVVRPESVCLDVGAAEGWVTLQIALLATQGTTDAFEPSARGDWIDRNLALNADRPLGAVTIQRTLVGAVDSSPQGDVPGMISLDRYAREQGIERVDVLKIDVDGPELEVLDGANWLLQNLRPAVCVEAHSHDLLRGTLERLERAGYACRVVEPPAHEHRPLGYNPTVFAEANPGQRP
ncbi:MAG: FkbM family methyltransferase [Lacipirellulaceae bacterium]